MTRPLAAVLLLTLVVAPAFADGMFLPSSLHGNATRPSSAAQKGIMIRQDADEVLLLQTTYHGPADRFAWVVPVPSKPSEIFAAEPAFVTETFKGTEPVVVTEFGKPRIRHNVKTASGNLPMAPPAPEAAGAPGAPPVQVLEEKEVGDYNAVVLAATSGGELQKWLAKNQYHLPAEAQPVLSDYVRRGWVFVALKMQEKRARQQPVLTEVAPLGLRFKCPRVGLVYPLAISRVSAPPLSALLLCVIANQPYTCQTIPSVWLTKKTKLQRQETYGDLRRKMTRNPTRMLCEFSGGPPLLYTDLGYRAEDWERERQAGLHTTRASRFFGLVTPEEMVDLTFAPDADLSHADYRVLVRRSAPYVPDARKHALMRITALVPGSAAQQAAVSGQPLYQPTPRKPADSWRVPVAVMIAFLGIIVLIVRKIGPALPLLALMLASGVAISGGMPGIALLNPLQGAVDLFQDDTGCLPATVGDLAVRKQPDTGLDASGNQVPLKGWRGPYLKDVPPGPVARGQLVIDPLNVYNLDSTGFDATCEAATRSEARNAQGEDHSAPRLYWLTTPPRAKGLMKPYHKWLRERQGHRLFGFAIPPGRGSMGSGVVIDCDAATYLHVTQDQCWFSSSGLIVSSHAATEERSPLYPDLIPGQSFCGITDSFHPFELLPRMPKNARIIGVAPDGAVLVVNDHQLTLLRPDGGIRRYEWSGEGVWDASLSRDGASIYIVSSRPSGYDQMVVSRLDLATGTIAPLADSVSGRSLSVGPDGVVCLAGNSLRHVAAGKPRQLVAVLAAVPPALALAPEYAYFAQPNATAPGGVICRASLKDVHVSPVAKYEANHLVLAADGDDLYIASITDYSTLNLTLLADGKKPIRLKERPAFPTPPNLPKVD